MSDTGRKDLTDKIGESVTPDSQKSTLDVAKENLTDVSDKVSGAVQPDSEKSATQSITDTTSSTSSAGDKSYLEQGKEAVINAAQAASDAVSGSTTTHE